MGKGHDLVMEFEGSWVDVHLEVPFNVEDFPEKVWNLQVAVPFGTGTVTRGNLEEFINFLQGILDEEEDVEGAD